ncbi:MAG: hypothetical protein BHW64_02655 [Candidatus Melainabacteria bacterium LEY3_CP_29_8]|nr:MAG: hypothetical protein BHW64_02655 [Candidatus Melainabacteria bacterium LEY3_CP_29_8]
MKKFILLFSFICFLSQFVYASEIENLSADEALKILKAGNIRFQTMKEKHPDQTKERRKELQKMQHPFAVVITCSDSRVPPSLIFDQGLGDIFEIRNAGNVLDNHVIGSVEYAVVHLGVKLVIVMGHENCGAVTAALSDVHESKFISSLTNSIEPALKMYDNNSKEDKLTSTIKNNALYVTNNLIKSDKILSNYIKNKGLKIMPAYYHLDSGKVEFLK